MWCCSGSSRLYAQLNRATERIDCMCNRNAIIFLCICAFCCTHETSLTFRGKICLMSEGLAKDIQADECGHIGVRGIFSDPIRLPLISVNIKRGGGSNYDNVADGVQVVCAIAPLKETSHSVMLSADVVADLECMPALSVMCVKVQNCDNNFECQSCNSHVNDCMVAEVDASNDDDDDDESIVLSLIHISEPTRPY